MTIIRRVNPAMIVLAREFKGLSQIDLAAGINTSQTMISRYESGTTEVAQDHLENMALLLQRPISFFYWSEKLYNASCMYHRKNRRISVSELRLIHAKVNLLRIQAFKLLLLANVKSKYSFFRLDPSKHNGPTGCAREVRRLWQLPLGPVDNLVRNIERAGGIVFRCPFGQVRVDGISQWIIEDERTPPVFFVHDDMPGDRQRWTLAHEIGHIVMHHIPGERDVEEEANEFASELLMPADEIGPDLVNMTLAKAAAMKSQWKVSMAAIIVRANQLQKIDTPKYQYLFKQMGIKGYRTREPVLIPPEDPCMFRDLLAFYRNKLGKGLDQISEILGETEENFRDVYASSFSGFRLIM